MGNYTYAKTHIPSLADSVVDISSRNRRKKPSGCTSMLFGCLSIMVIVCLIFASGFLYIYTMDKDEALGSVAVKLIKNQSIHFNLTADFNHNPNIPFDDKLAMRVSYDRILSDFDNMPGEKQTAIKKNLGVLIKKFINQPELLRSGVLPPEVHKLVTLILPQAEQLVGISQTDIPEDKIWMALVSESKKAKLKSKKKTRRRSRRNRRRRYQYTPR